MTATAKKTVTKKKTTAKKKTVSKKTTAKKTTRAKTAAPKKSVPKVSPGMTITEALGESFLTDLISDWQTNGTGVIETCRTTKPDAYLKLIATYAPKEFRKTLEPFEGMTDATLQQKLNETLEALNALKAGTGSGTGK